MQVKASMEIQEKLHSGTGCGPNPKLRGIHSSPTRSNGLRRQKSKGLKLNDHGTVNQMDTKVSKLELKVLYDISQIIGQALNLDQTLEIILEILSEYLSMKRATITLKHGEEDTLSIRASHGL